MLGGGERDSRVCAGSGFSSMPYASSVLIYIKYFLICPGAYNEPQACGLIQVTLKFPNT
jgi:hypothetical protein